MPSSRPTLAASGPMAVNPTLIRRDTARLGKVVKDSGATVD